VVIQGMAVVFKL